MANILDKIIKYGLYLLVILLPVFFLPVTLFPLALNKQLLLALFSAFLLVLWLVKIIGTGELKIKLGGLNKAVFLLLIILGFSFAFSGARSQSFWGMSAEPDTFLNFILYILVFFLFANLARRKETEEGQKAFASVFKIVLLFLASSGILAVLFLLQLFFKIFPWDFAGFNGFNPVGSVQALAVFLGGAFVILLAVINGRQLNTEIFDRANFRKIIQTLLVILGFLFFVIIFLIDYQIAWLSIAFGMLALILGKLGSANSNVFKQNIFKNFGLPLIILVFALIFIFIRLPVGNILNVSSEVGIGHKLSFDIASATLTESPKNFILGSGPATFGYQYSLYKPTYFNFTDFWQVRFPQGASVMTTFLTTFGVLGILAILLMMVIFFRNGLKALTLSALPASDTEVSALEKYSGLKTAIFAGGFYFFLLWFFYPANFSLIFVSFLMMGLWEAAGFSDSGEPKPATKILLYQSPQKTFFVMFCGMILLAGSVIGFYNVGKKYVGAMNYAQGLKFFNQEDDLDGAIIEVQKAVILGQKDVYLGSFSQLFLVKANETLENQELSSEQGQALFQQDISNAEATAKEACRINPKNSLNWLYLGNLYENIGLLASLTGEVYQPAIQSYQRAQELDPQNPQIPLNIGRIYLTGVQDIKQELITLEMAEEKDEETIKKFQDLYKKNLEIVMQNIEESLRLKSNFSPAYYLMGQAYEIQEENALALQSYQAVLVIEPNNEQIKAKIEAIKKILQEE